MSWEMKELPESGSRKEVHVTSFFGGQDTGRCLQLTQQVDVKGDGNMEVQFVHLTREQAMELVKRVTDWDDGTCNEHAPHGPDREPVILVSGE